MRLPALSFASLVLLLSACQRAPAPPKPANGDYAVQTWVLPADAGSMAPDLVAGPGGRVLLGWINRREGRRNALQFASYSEADGWQSQPRTIAVGNALQANAADTPHLLATPDGALWAQWVQAQPDAAGGTDVVLARSKDGGMTWTQITRVNTDGMPTEHGFAALWADGSDGAGIAWLDGRGKRPAPLHGSTDAHGEGEGDMQLRANRFTLDLARASDAVVDPRSCDCCQVAVAITRRGPLLAWRSRDANAVRDIATARYQQGAWTAPRIAHADGWKVEGCPVNGPALAARDADVALAWYSEGSGQPAVSLTRSQDAGDQFGPPVTVAAGANVLGRPAVALDARQVWVAWLEQAERGQRLQLARYAPDLAGKPLQVVTVAHLATRGLASGYPRLVVDAGGAWLAWTDVDTSGVAHLKGARVTR